MPRSISSVVLRAAGVPAALVCAATLLAGCAPDREGIHAGECRNGIDEDRDNRMDCADPDCAGSPDCAAPEGSAEEVVDETPVADFDVPELLEDTGTEDAVRFSKSPVWREVAAGVEHTCALRVDGTMACFGRPPTSLPEEDVTVGLDGQFSSIDSGQGFSCALEPGMESEDGVVKCWGAPTYEATQPPLGMFRRMSLGYSHGCAQSGDGALECWGWAGHDALVPPAGDILDFDLGYHFGCAVMADTSIACWGKDLYNDNVVPPTGSFVSLDVGAMFGCALPSVPGELACWGEGGLGQTAPPAESFVAFSLGSGHGCGIRPDTTLACWGDDIHGQATPPDSDGWVSLSSGAHHTCATDQEGWMACWGWNESGRAQPPE
jgi:hypothetical protein